MSTTTAMRLKLAKGFTLIEVAVVLVIVGFLLASVLMPLRSQQDSAKINKAQEDLKSIEEALYGFAIVNGRLPCPTLPGQGGAEVGGGAADCTFSFGFVPSTTLGVKGSVNCDGLLLDPWGNPYRYSVTDSNLGAVAGADFVRNGQIQSESQASNLTALTTNIAQRVCINSACGTTVANNVVAVFFSMGKNWPNFTSADEVENSGEANRNASPGCASIVYRMPSNFDFVSHDRVEIPGQEFDDIVFWISPNILYSRMLAAGRLP